MHILDDARTHLLGCGPTSQFPVPRPYFTRQIYNMVSCTKRIAAVESPLTDTSVLRTVYLYHFNHSQRQRHRTRHINLRFALGAFLLVSYSLTPLIVHPVLPVPLAAAGGTATEGFAVWSAHLAFVLFILSSFCGKIESIKHVGAEAKVSFVKVCTSLDVRLWPWLAAVRT